MSSDARTPEPAPERASRVTITDVAREAGVSVATVSKVINGRDGIAAQTAGHVMDVVNRMGYAPSMIAASMRRTRSRPNIIGVLVAGFDPYAAELLRGVSAEAVGKGYELLSYSGAISDDSTVGWEQRSLGRLGDSLIAGAIILTPTVVLPSTTVPIVAVDPRADEGGPATIDCDNAGGAQAATEHLIGLGHRRIAHVRGRSDLMSAQLREEGYRRALAGAGIDYRADLVRSGEYRAPVGREVARELLTGPERPTAIFAANDQSALAVLQVAGELGLRVPEDLSIVGFDDIPEAAGSYPRLTTAAQPLQEMGAQALRTLLALLDGNDTEQHVRLPTRLVIRESTAPVSGV